MLSENQIKRLLFQSENASKSGLHKKNFNDQIVIPDFFEPFVKKNINLRWAIKTSNSIMTPMFKGDCDQDRPNELHEWYEKLDNSYVSLC